MCTSIKNSRIERSKKVSTVPIANSKIRCDQRNKQIIAEDVLQELGFPYIRMKHFSDKFHGRWFVRIFFGEIH